MEKHKIFGLFINYTKLAQRCHLEILSKSSHSIGRKILHPAIHGRRPSGKTHFNRTKSQACRTYRQKISISGRRSGGSDFHRNNRTDQSDYYLQCRQR